MTPPVIGIDASRVAVDRLTGTESYTLQLLRAMVALQPTEQFRLYLNATQPPARLPNLGDAVCIPFPRLWTHSRLSLEMLRRRPDVLFVPAHVIPLVHPRSVVTIHDLGYLHHPESHTSSAVRMLDWTTRWSARVATRIIAVSGATKRDLIERYRVPPAKIEVVHLGVAPEFARAGVDAIQSLRDRLTLPARFVLAVGTRQPRKNYGRLAEAVARLRAQGHDLSLVIAGKPGWMAAQVDQDLARSGLCDGLTMLGYVEDSDLPALYSAAEVVCQPSLYEGFGLPVIEAMACGTPVVAANAGSLPEIAGDAAVLVDPLDPDSIAEGIHRVWTGVDLRGELIVRGRARAASMTWQRCAEETLSILRQVAAM